MTKGVKNVGKYVTITEMVSVSGVRVVGTAMLGTKKNRVLGPPPDQAQPGTGHQHALGGKAVAGSPEVTVSSSTRGWESRSQIMHRKIQTKQGAVMKTDDRPHLIQCRVFLHSGGGTNSQEEI